MVITLEDTDDDATYFFSEVYSNEHQWHAQIKICRKDCQFKINVNANVSVFVLIW